MLSFAVPRPGTDPAARLATISAPNGALAYASVFGLDKHHDWLKSAVETTWTIHYSRNRRPDCEDRRHAMFDADVDNFRSHLKGNSAHNSRHGHFRACPRARAQFLPPAAASRHRAYSRETSETSAPPSGEPPARKAQVRCRRAYIRDGTIAINRLSPHLPMGGASALRCQRLKAVQGSARVGSPLPAMPRRCAASTSPRRTSSALVYAA